MAIRAVALRRAAATAAPGAALLRRRLGVAPSWPSLQARQEVTRSFCEYCTSSIYSPSVAVFDCLHTMARFLLW